MLGQQRFEAERLVLIASACVDFTPSRLRDATTLCSNELEWRGGCTAAVDEILALAVVVSTVERSLQIEHDVSVWLMDQHVIQSP
jgi:hypothetical protein